MIKGAIFDLDGTLVDSMNMWVNIDTHYLMKYNYAADEFYRKKIAELSFHDGAVLISSLIGIPVEQVELEIKELAKSEYENTIPLKEGVTEYLKHLKKQKIKLCIATSCIDSLCVSSLKRNKIFEYFDYFLYSSDVGVGKTEPDIFLRAAQIMELLPNEIIVFEDMFFAARSAKGIGMQVIGVYDEFSKNQQDLLLQYSDKVITSFKEMM